MTDLSLAELTQAHRLRRLHRTLGWRYQFRRSATPPHDVEELVFSFEHRPWLDVLRVRSVQDAHLARITWDSVARELPEPEIRWSTSGTLTEVLDALDCLPALDVPSKLSTIVYPD